MSNYTQKLDLSKLSGFGITNLQGKSGVTKKCVVIPVEENHIFIGEHGAYLDLVCFETNNNQYGNSHFITRSKSKEEREQEKSSGQRLQLPILGNLKIMESTNNGNFGGGEQYTQTVGHSVTQSMPTDNQDLPF